MDFSAGYKTIEEDCNDKFGSNTSDQNEPDIKKEYDETSDDVVREAVYIKTEHPEMENYEENNDYYHSPALTEFGGGNILDSTNPSTATNSVNQEMKEQLNIKIESTDNNGSDNYEEATAAPDNEFIGEHFLTSTDSLAATNTSTEEVNKEAINIKLEPADNNDYEKNVQVANEENTGFNGAHFLAGGDDLEMLNTERSNIVQESTKINPVPEDNSENEDEPPDKDTSKKTKPDTSEEIIVGNHGKGVSVKLLSCDVCDKQFVYNYQLVTHQRTHTGEKKYKCDICGVSVSQKWYLIVHKRKHSGERPFICECGDAFFQKSELVGHQLRHTSDKPFKCDECEETFTQKTNLFRHQRRRHNTEKPFKCDECCETFTQKTNLIRHQKRRHTSEKPFTCKTCNKSFSQPLDLERHEKTHSGDRPFKCDLCNKAFCDNGNLYNHKKTHSKEKPHKCNDCDKAYSRLSHLRDHERLHSGDKPFQCQLCEREFTRNSFLVKHMRTHAQV